MCYADQPVLLRCCLTAVGESFLIILPRGRGKWGLREADTAWRGGSKMEGNERPSTEAAVPKTDAGSAATQTTQPSAAVFFALNFATEST